MRVLVATTVNFSGIARMPRALSVAGWEVAVLCLQDSYIDASRYIDRRFHIKAPMVQRQFHRPRALKQQTGHGYLTALVRAVESWQPALVVPGDEPTARFIHQVVHAPEAGRQATVPAPVLAILERSLGNSECYGALLNKRTTRALAVSLGIEVPEQVPASSLAEAVAAADTIGYPVVLKRAVGYGGDGVIVCRDAGALRRAWRRSTSPTSNLPRRLENLARRGIGDPLGAAWHPTDQGIDIQRFVAGRAAGYSLVAVRGRCLAGFSVVAEQQDPVSSASTVVRFVENPQMEQAAAALAAHCGYTGFLQFDFIVDDATGRSLLLESNPRPTPATHLGAMAGTDLCAALLGGLDGSLREPPQKAREGAVVALFPQEWARQPSSPYLHDAYHDVPWDEPALVKAYAKTVK